MSAVRGYQEPERVLGDGAYRAERMRPPEQELMEWAFGRLMAGAGAVWVSPEDFAGIVQRLIGVDAVNTEQARSMLHYGLVEVDGLGAVRRFEWGWGQ